MTIRYVVLGDRSAVDHVELRLDQSDEEVDGDLQGPYVFEGLERGVHWVRVSPRRANGHQVGLAHTIKFFIE